MQTAALHGTSELNLPSGSYIYEIIQPEAAPAQLAATCSDDSLRLVDSTSLHESQPGLQDVHKGVTCLRTVRDQPSILLTAGRDGAVRGWDLRSGQKAAEHFMHGGLAN